MISGTGLSRCLFYNITTLMLSHILRPNYDLSNFNELGSKFARQMLISLSAGNPNSIFAIGHATDEITNCCVKAVVLPDTRFTSIFRHACSS